MRKFSVFVSGAIFCCGEVEIEAECELDAEKQARELHYFGEIEMENSGYDQDVSFLVEEVKDA